MYFIVYYREFNHSQWIELCIVNTQDSTIDKHGLAEFFKNNYLIIIGGEVEARETTLNDRQVDVDVIFDYNDLVEETDKYARGLREKVNELAEIDSTLKKLLSRKRALENNIFDCDKVLTKNGSIEYKFYLKKGKIAKISDSESEKLELPVRIEPIRCKFCRDIVQHENEHYFPGSYEPWSCYQWNHP